ncbi:hypothetical protein K0M31_013919 [Melipona bicolor]|uniref:Uncharacterized protein n=1 Tax=Melipona bicolor TaxID=60889 RepID=A0AA40G7S7_9HYME|nr:hypothetical protein K0M31_013919 [Melipona bicolor]
MDPVFHGQVRRSRMHRTGTRKVIERYGSPCLTSPARTIVGSRPPSLQQADNGSRPVAVTAPAAAAAAAAAVAAPAALAAAVACLAESASTLELGLFGTPYTQIV